MGDRPIRLLYEGALGAGVRTAIESLGWGDRLGWRAPAGTESFVRKVRFRSTDLVIDRSQRTAVVKGALDPSLGGPKLGDTPYRRARTETMRELAGIVFTVDSQSARMDENRHRLALLLADLRFVGRDPANVPLVFQLNKRDLPRIEDLDVLRAELAWEGPVDHVPTVATQGRGLGDAVTALLARL